MVYVHIRKYIRTYVHWDTCPMRSMQRRATCQLADMVSWGTLFSHNRHDIALQWEEVHWFELSVINPTDRQTDRQTERFDVTTLATDVLFSCG